MVVAAAWIFYRYAAPRSWLEWRGAGLVQAFIIALYEEMYGFPLTIYLLTGFLGVDLPLTPFSGHLWVTLPGFGAIGAMIEMLLGYGLLFLGIYLLIRGWREVHQASREGRLATTGRYGVVRHPQCTGDLPGAARPVDPLVGDPHARPLAVPGMPTGVPGMPGEGLGSYDVLSFQSDGETQVYASK